MLQDYCPALFKRDYSNRNSPSCLNGNEGARVGAESDVIGGHGGLALKKRGETGILVLGSSDLLPSQRLIFFLKEAQLTARSIFGPLSGELL